MNNKQKTILCVAAIIVIAMTLYPPFHLVISASKLNKGYSFILNPAHDGKATVDVLTLFAQWACVLIVSAIGWCVAKD